MAPEQDFASSELVLPLLWTPVPLVDDRRRFDHPVSCNPFGSWMSEVHPTSLLAAVMEASHLT